MMRYTACALACGLLAACSSQIVAIPPAAKPAPESVDIRSTHGEATLEQAGYGFFTSKAIANRYRLDDEALKRDFGPSLEAQQEILAAGLPELQHSYMAILRDDSGPVGSLTFDSIYGAHSQIEQPGQVAYIDGYPEAAKDLDAKKLLADFGPALATLKETQKGQRSYLILLESPDGSASQVTFKSRHGETLLDHTGQSITLDGLAHEAEDKLARDDFTPSRQATKEILDAGLPVLPHSYTALLSSGAEPLGEVEILEGHAKGVVLAEPGQAVIIDGYSSQIFSLDDQRYQQDFSETAEALPPAPVTVSLYFQSGSAQLTKDARALLPVILDEIRKHPAADITVSGFTDTVNGVAFNEQLSKRRSEAVAAFVRKSGVPFQEMTLASYGKDEAMLAIPTPDNTPQELNRRVEVSIR